MTEVAAAPHEAEPQLERQLEQHRRELTGYCYRMLGSSFEADDAVQAVSYTHLTLPTILLV